MRKTSPVLALSSAATRPPQYDANFRVTRKLRFKAKSSSGIVPISVATLCECFGLVCTATNATAVPVWGFIRVKKIECWASPDNTQGAGTITQNSSAAIVWGLQNALGVANFGTNREVRDDSTSAAYPAHVVATPPRGSNASLWQSRLDQSGVRRTGAGNTVFSVLPTTGCIVDVTVEMVAMDAGKSTAVPAIVITTGTAGAYAYANLDGIGGVFEPAGVDAFT